MSSKTSKLKDGLKQLAQQVGLPVEGVLKDFNTFIDVIKSPQQTSDLCEEMIAYLETIERSLRDTDGEFKEELDELNNYLKEMKTTIEEHKSLNTRVSALMREAATQELIDRLSQRLSNSLVIFNTRVTLRRRHSTSAELVQTIQDLRSDMEKLTARLDASATEVDNNDDVIIMRDIRLEDTRLIYEKNGLVRAHKAIWKTRKVELREFVGGDTESKKAAWKREVDFYKRLRHARALKMWGISRPSEPNPYIVYSPGGVDYREYFRVRRPVAEVFNFLRSVNDAFIDFYQMGCYNWESIMISADQGPVIKLQHENSRNRGEAVDSIARLVVESQDREALGDLVNEASGCAMVGHLVLCNTIYRSRKIYQNHFRTP